MIKKVPDAKYTWARPGVIFGDKSKNPERNGVVHEGPVPKSWNGMQSVRTITAKDITGKPSKDS